MPTYIALFRGINVGGRHRIKMADLRSLLEDLGLEDVNSYIQSGNVVFRSKKVDTSELSEQISAAIAENYDFKPNVFILEKKKFIRAMEANPFPDAESDDRRLHLTFLEAEPENPDMDGLREVKKESEEYELKGQKFYLYAPEGIGRSKLANKAEKLLGVSTTSRNWRTMGKIREMAEELM
ncbi:MAG: DUF1697 domain-containing protein [Candidatus Marinimicrobia bacterium]|nr:DUF1697 domain-containing protein [Candidatus Neomarinimicrobiota bacterium]MCF7829139.1 DUF1697 domain-containing protein [Candidatus Neomarinimicrobiota bacterium]MCF7881208.1 DUF1697 domain-containing protein [Candidatus Neomarinimicrobiota bacterium]